MSRGGDVARFYIPWVPRPGLMKRMGRWHVQIFRLTGGVIGRRADGLDMLLLTTRGRKTGLARATPLPYFVDADRLILIASFGGGEVDPAWAINLDAEPEVGIELSGESFAARARRARPAERARLWATITAEHPRYQVYQSNTSREIPVIVVEREGAPAA